MHALEEVSSGVKTHIDNWGLTMAKMAVNFIRPPALIHSPLIAWTTVYKRIPRPNQLRGMWLWLSNHACHGAGIGITMWVQCIADSAWRVGKIWKSDDAYEISSSKKPVELDFKHENY